MAHSALLMIRHIQAVSQQQLPARAPDSMGDGNVRFDSVLIMFASSGVDCIVLEELV